MALSFGPVSMAQVLLIKKERMKVDNEMTYRRWTLRTALLVTILWSGLFAIQANATPITFTYKTIIDTGRFGLGGAANTDLTAIYTFDSLLAAGTGPAGDTGITKADYLPITTIDLCVGSEHVLVLSLADNPTNGIKISDKDPGLGQDQYKVEVKDSSDFGGATILGHEVVSFEVQFKDVDGTMFSDTTLPLTTLFASEVDVIAGKLILQSNNIVLDFSGGVLSDQGAPQATPEPGTLLLLGSALAGLGLFRRRAQSAP